MGETKVNNAYDPYEPDLWLMDGSDVEYPADFKDLEPLPKELEARLDALADEIFGSVDEVQPAA